MWVSEFDTVRCRPDKELFFYMGFGISWQSALVCGASRIIRIRLAESGTLLTDALFLFGEGADRSTNNRCFTSARTEHALPDRSKYDLLLLPQTDWSFSLSLLLIIAFFLLYLLLGLTVEQFISTVSSQQGSQLSVRRLYVLHLHLGFLQVVQFPPTLQNHHNWGL